MGRGKGEMKNSARKQMIRRQGISNKTSRGLFKQASELVKLFQLQMQIDESKVEELKEEVLDLEVQMNGLDTDSQKQESLQELKDSYEVAQDQIRSRTCDSLKTELDKLRRTALEVMGGIDQIEQKVILMFGQDQIHVSEFKAPLVECERHFEAQNFNTTSAQATQQMKTDENDQYDGGEDTSLLLGL